jgi:hypothetical protein
MPKALIEQLLSLKMNENEIAAELCSDGVPVTQATINRIRRGRIKSTSFEIGKGLERLLERRGTSNSHASPVERVA